MREDNYFLPLKHKKLAFLALFRGTQMAYLGSVRSIINAHVQHYVRSVPLGSPVLLNPAGDNVEHLSC